MLTTSLDRRRAISSGEYSIGAPRKMFCVGCWRSVPTGVPTRLYFSRMSLITEDEPRLSRDYHWYRMQNSDGIFRISEVSLWLRRPSVRHQSIVWTVDCR